MSESRKIKAGEAYAASVGVLALNAQGRPSALRALGLTVSALRAMKENSSATDGDENLRRLRSELESLKAGVVAQGRETELLLTNNGLPLAGANIDQWIHLARVIERPPESFENLGELLDEALAFVDRIRVRKTIEREIEQKARPVSGQKISGDLPDRMSIAIALKTRNPEWTDSKIASAAGYSDSSALSRSSSYQKIKQAMRDRGPRFGTKDRKGNIEVADD